jgi:hypothetical protein
MIEYSENIHTHTHTHTYIYIYIYMVANVSLERLTKSLENYII